jgi:post-segregation antitoxin (ccd killing protein)
VYDLKAPKQTVSLSINSDLYGQAMRLGIDVSVLAEEALGREVTERVREQIKAEIRQDLEAIDAHEAEHGSFVEMLREHEQSMEEKEEAP